MTTHMNLEKEFKQFLKMAGYSGTVSPNSPVYGIARRLFFAGCVSMFGALVDKKAINANEHLEFVKQFDTEFYRENKPGLRDCDPDEMRYMIEKQTKAKLTAKQLAAKVRDLGLTPRGNVEAWAKLGIQADP